MNPARPHSGSRPNRIRFVSRVCGSSITAPDWGMASNYCKESRQPDMRRSRRYRCVIPAWMGAPGMSTTAIVDAIKRRLRAQGITYQTLAKRLKVSEPTVKRDLSRGDFSLKRLDVICEVLGVTITDLVNEEPA